MGGARGVKQSTMQRHLYEAGLGKNVFVIFDR